MTEEYKVKLDVFEGPLDLLLYLIKKEEIDIYNIPIESITTQYMEYLNLMRMLDLNIAGEFIVMAATLMLIKSRLLLPEEDRSEAEEEEDDDPRWELVRQLLEYKKFKDAASSLHDQQLLQENIFQLGKEKVANEAGGAGVTMQDVSLFDLIAAFQDVLKNVPADDIVRLEAEVHTVADKIDTILAIIARQKTVDFTALFDEMASRNEIICTFLALLELLRLRQVEARQKGAFAPIQICQVESTAIA